MKKISEQVMNVLDAAGVDGNVVRLNSGMLDRKLYVEVNKVLESLGGKWNRKEKGHVFPDDPAEIFDEVLLTGEYSNKKTNFGAFFTPQWLAEEIVQRANLGGGLVDILEPSAGSGAIADAVIRRYPEYKSRIWLNEIQPNLYGMLKGKGYKLVRNGDFLDMTPPLESWPRIVMNPPFAKQADVRHVLRAWELLSPGGRLVAIMSAGIKFRTNKLTQSLRAIIDEFGAINDNPENAFSESGTQVNTVTVILDKAA